MKAAFVGFVVMLILGAGGSAAARLAFVHPTTPLPDPQPLAAPLDTNTQLPWLAPSQP